MSVKTFFKDFVDLWSETFTQLVDDKWFKMSASLSYMTILSLGPLLLVVITVTGILLGPEAARGEILRSIQGSVGYEAAKITQTVIEKISMSPTSWIAAIVSAGVAILGSVGVFVELKESLNIIWGVETMPGMPIKSFFKTRLYSFIMVLGLGSVIILLFITNTALSGLAAYWGEGSPALVFILRTVGNVFLFLVLAFMFAMIYRYLPDVHIKWRFVWMGAGISAALFVLGNFLIGLYLANTSYGSYFGAAGSLIIMLIYLNYSGAIFYLGAEFVHIYLKRFSPEPLRTRSGTVFITKTSILIEEAVKNMCQEKDISAMKAESQVKDAHNETKEVVKQMAENQEV
ncbi:MAG: YihY/virulence factor BrkB family protein [Chloroflexota bacterium]